ncbi:hypothetical protein ABIA94_001668 [Bradyrhizobium sp. LA7.1]
MADFVAKVGCNRRMSFGHSVRPTGFDPPTLTREAPQILSDCSKNKLVLGAPWATKPKPTKPQDALQVRKPHLDLLALTSRRLESLGASERPGDVPGVLMYVARDLARWFFWTALRFKRACVAVELARTIQKRFDPVHGAARPEPLSGRGSGKRRWSDHIESRCARRYRHLASTCRTRGYVVRCPSPRPASSASEQPRKRYPRQAAPA